MYEWTGATQRLAVVFRSPTQRERRAIGHADCHLALLTLPAAVFLLVRFDGFDWTAAICPTPAPPASAPHHLEIVLQDALNGATVVARKLTLPQAFAESLHRALAIQPAAERRELLRQLALLRARYGPDRDLLPLATARCLAEEPPAAIASQLKGASPALPGVSATAARVQIEPREADSNANQPLIGQAQHTPRVDTAHRNRYGDESSAPPSKRTAEPQGLPPNPRVEGTAYGQVPADDAAEPPASVAPAEPRHRPLSPPAVERIEGADDFISIPRAAALAGLAPATLRSQATRRKRSLRTLRLADRGVVTTRRWLHEYLAQRDPRGSRQPLPASYIAP